MGGIRKEREDYISGSGPANKNQRVLAKEAIVGLLKKGIHTPVEISEHFGIAEEIVNDLVKELVKSGRIVRSSGKRQHLSINDAPERWCLK